MAKDPKSAIPKTPDQSPSPKTVKLTDESVKSSQYNKKLLYLLPVAIVLLIGLAFLLVRLKQSLAPEQTLTQITSSPLFLAIDSPKESVGVVNGEILVSGQTLPETTVLIYSNDDESILESNQQGKFETTVLVGNTGGLLRITAVSPTGEEETQTFDIYDNTQAAVSENTNVLGKKDSAPGQVKKTDTASAAENKPDKNSNKPEAKPTPDIKIKTETINKFLETKKVISKSNKIGAAKIKQMLSWEGSRSGEATGSQKLKKMIAVEATAATMKRHGISGVIIDVTDGMLIIAHQIHREIINTVYYNANTLITSKNSSESATFARGMRIACVGEPIDGGILAKRIHIIPGIATGVFSKNPIATPSGQLTATPSAHASASGTPKPSITATPSATPLISPSPTPT